jgi:hypothetical protein
MNDMTPTPEQRTEKLQGMGCRPGLFNALFLREWAG